MGAINFLRSEAVLHYFFRLEDEIAIVRKDEQNDVEQIKKQIFNLRDELTNQRASYVPQIDSAKEGFQTISSRLVFMPTLQH